jgi:predicted membrane chloride channel (bestrophin family)
VLFIDWKIVQVITAMTTFFEVFYTNHVFARYMRLYTLSRGILGSLSNFAFDMRIHAGTTHQALVRLATRFFLASVFLFFYELNGQVSRAEWENLMNNKLLYPEEVQVLQNFKRTQRSLVVLHWAGRVVGEAILSAKAPNNVIKGLVDRLISVREQKQQIRDTLMLPMPFQYFHLLNMMVVVNLLLWAYGMGTTQSIFAPVGFFFAELIFCGMMELAGEMSDPFGSDEIDFPLHVWLANALWDTSVVLEYEYTWGKGGWQQIAEKCPPLEMTMPDVSAILVTEDIKEAEVPSPIHGGHADMYMPLMNVSAVSASAPPREREISIVRSEGKGKAGFTKLKTRESEFEGDDDDDD